MSKKRVLIVVNYFYPYVSGVSEYARAIAASLATHHEVTVLTGKHLPDLPDQELFEGYTLVRAKPLFFLDKGYISSDFVSTFKRLARQHDVINMHLPMLESGLLSLLTSRPLLLTYQCDMAIVGGALSRLAVMGVRLSMRLALARSKAVVVLSEDYAMSSPLARGYHKKLVEVAPPNRFEGEALGRVKCSQNTNMICGFVGRFVLEKGIETIIEAARMLKDEPFEFWLAGDYKDVAGGSVFERLKNDIESLGGKVRLLGRLSNEELIEFYRSIDILLLPSTNRFEAFGMVQMEAMTFGATVVTSDMPGVRETARKTKIGQLCEPGSGRSLADAILRARVERQNVSREDVRTAVRREFGNNKFVDAYLALVEKLSIVDAV
jgi:glycosyltransferase involved in cell wall biosynthesis